MENLSVRVRYFARLREEAGLAEETVASPSRTLEELWREVEKRHGFSLDIDVVRPAVNDEFRSWNSAFAEGDLVVFMPPMAGG